MFIKVENDRLYISYSTQMENIFVKLLCQYFSDFTRSKLKTTSPMHQKVQYIENSVVFILKLYAVFFVLL
jgi:hypothetical protein